MLAEGLTDEQITCRVRWDETLAEAEYRHLQRNRCWPVFLAFESEPEAEPMALAA
jgi:hypothetical protein